MSFVSDRDLKKVPLRKANTGLKPRSAASSIQSAQRSPSSPSPSSSVGPSTTTPLTLTHTQTPLSQTSLSHSTPSAPPRDEPPLDIASVARREREQRQQLKQRCVSAARVQAWFRGRAAARALFRSLASQLRAQLQDVAKVRALVASSSAQPFVVPAAVATAMLARFLFLSRRAHTLCRVTDCLTDLCSLVVRPSVESEDESKNLLLADVSLRRVRELLSLLLRAVIAQRSDTATLVVLSQTLHALLFSSTGSRASVRFAEAQKPLRDSLSSSHALREGLLSLTQSVLSVSVEEMDAYDSFKQKTSKSFPGLLSAASTLFSLSRRLTFSHTHTHTADGGENKRSKDQGKEEDATAVFVREILSIPALSVCVHDAQLADWLQEERSLHAVFASLLCVNGKRVSASALALSLDATIDRELQMSALQCVAGNILGVFSASVFAKLSSAQQQAQTQTQTQAQRTTTPSASLLRVLLQFCALFCAKLPLSDLTRDGAAIAWTVSGTKLVARERPRVLALQCSTLLDRVMLTQLFDLVCGERYRERDGVSVRSDTSIDMSRWAESKDAAEIESALQQSSAGIIQKKLAHESSSSWLGSSWAARLGLTGTASTRESREEKAKSSSSSSSSSGGLFSWFSFGLKSSAAKSSTSSSSSSSSFVESVDKTLVFELMRVWALLLAPAATTRYTSEAWRFLSALTFSRPLVPFCWAMMREHTQGFETLCAKFSVEDTKDFSELTEGFALIATFTAALKVFLMSMDDMELYEKQKPIPLHQILPLLRGCNKLLYQLLACHAQLSGLNETPISTNADLANKSIDDSRSAVRHCYATTLRNLHFVLSDLFARWARRPFCSVQAWLVADANTTSFLAAALGRVSFSFSATTLQWMPWAVDFPKRLKFVRDELDRAKLFAQHAVQTTTVVRIRRSQVLMDGMQQLLDLSPELWRGRISVRYVSKLGTEEIGIDAGGLFKDFVTDLSARIFDPSYGLFSQTSEGLLFPNPSAGSIYRHTELESMFLFIGRVVGKALLENITISPQFTHFFLAFMHGRYNFMNLLDDLFTFDADLYKNLMFLKNCEEEMAADLSLTFSVTDNSFGDVREIDLIPNGRNINVTARNRNLYVSSVAKYYLHDRIRVQAGAFFHGLHELVDPVLLKVFCPAEMQILISGSLNEIDVGDWKSNTHYTGGFTSMDPSVYHFWSLVEEMTDEEKGELLRFVTSVPRPPSLGFSALNPPFTIQHVDSENDSRLPTASTCFNILRLPKYSSKQVLKQKLLMAISARAGFDLS